MNPYIQAQRLVDSLRESEEYKYLVRLQKEIEESEELKVMLDNYQEIQEEMHSLQLMDQEIDDHVKDEIHKLTKLLESIPILREYLDAERKMCVIIQDIQDMIMGPINEIFGGLDRKYNQM